MHEDPPDTDAAREQASLWMRRWTLASGIMAALWLAVIYLPKLGFSLENKRPHAQETSSKLVSLSVYQLTPDGRSVQIGNTISQSDGLSFSYANRGPTPHKHLMIFAVDAKGVSHWYHPQLLDEQTNPISIPISANQTPTALTQTIRYALARGPLTVYGVFSKQPIDLKTVRAHVILEVQAPTWKPGAAISLPLNDTAMHLVTTQVE